jgi:predicted N-formylglutamate amidohydrolase
MTTLYQRSWPQMNETPDSLLATDEPPPFTVDNENGTSPLLIVADHAGKHFPRRLGQLGLSNAECERHIAWDIGVGAVCCLIGKALNAVVVRQNYSRLVIDCNRTPGSGTSVLDLSELTRVPGNIGLSERHQLARVREIFRPYHDRIATELDRRREAARPTTLISVHSFTPVFKTVARLWHVGVLYNRDPRFAQILMELLHREEGLVLGDNEPYSVTDASDYTIPVHGEQRDLHHVALEIRQDLITDEAGQRKLAALFVRLLPQAYERLTSLQIPKSN